MTGLIYISQLPDSIKSKITEDFESLQQFYLKVFDLCYRDYSIFMNKPKGFEQAREQIQNLFYDIEDKLDTYEIDGGELVTEIRSDFGEIIVNKRIQKLNSYLSQFGTDFETLREILTKEYGI
jgi:predicted enzyme related to lactoylglutathione lyase